MGFGWPLAVRLPSSMIPLMASARCVAGSASIEVGVERVLPLAQGPAQASDVGDGTRW